MPTGIEDILVCFYGLSGRAIVQTSVFTFDTASRERGDSLENGVYVVNQGTQKVIMVENSDIVINNPSEWIIVIPELVPGI